MVDVDSYLECNCSVARQYVTIDDVRIINALITEPSVIEDKLPENYRERLEGMIQAVSTRSSRYSDDHETDAFGLSQFETLENFFETEFHYICDDRSDILYLSAMLMYRITGGHPFEEGNKRTAYLSACLMLSQHHMHNELEEAVIPKLDENLLNALEDIASEDESYEAEDLEQVYRKPMKEELEKLLNSD